VITFRPAERTAEPKVAGYSLNREAWIPLWKKTGKNPENSYSLVHLERGCRMLDAGCWMLDDQSSRFRYVYPAVEGYSSGGGSPAGGDGSPREGKGVGGAARRGGGRNFRVFLEVNGETLGKFILGQ